MIVWTWTVGKGFTKETGSGEGVVLRIVLSDTIGDKDFPNKMFEELDCGVNRFCSQFDRLEIYSENPYGDFITSEEVLGLLGYPYRFRKGIFVKIRNVDWIDEKEDVIHFLERHGVICSGWDIE